MAPSGLVVVDKPAGITSHDVVGKLRRIVGTRRVGHAGTLDPMATGVLVVGVEGATKLLGHLALATKEYEARIRFGASTTTDDAEGEVVAEASAHALTRSDVESAVAGFVGEIEQVPAAVSAVKVDGRRAYARVRAGESVELAPRRVTVSRFEVVAAGQPGGAVFDVDVAVECSSGTYIRALARDVGAVLGVGGHLTRLRRVRVGRFGIAEASTLEELAEASDPVRVPLAQAVAEGFGRRDVDHEQARIVSHGGRLAPTGNPGPYGVFAPSGEVVALFVEDEQRARPLVVFPPS